MSDPSQSPLHELADVITPMTIRVAATLGVADHLAADVTTAAAIAERTQVRADLLDRLMRHLVTVGVVARDPAGGYRPTASGDALRSDHPQSLRPWLDLEGALGRGDLAAFRLLESVRTGEQAYRATYGRSFWDDLRAEPRLRASFDALMSSQAEGDLPAIVSAYGWSTVEEVVDVGGGDGSLLVALLRAYPELRGTLVEEPGAARRAEQKGRAAQVAERLEIVVGSFFDALPSGGDVYVLAGVLHNWDDEHARRILARCAEAAGTTGTILVVEGFLDQVDPPRTAMDIRMLIFVGGRERTIEELGTLAASVGRRIDSVTKLGRYATLVALASEER